MLSGIPALREADLRIVNLERGRTTGEQGVDKGEDGSTTSARGPRCWT